jgi:hypothetical protein
MNCRNLESIVTELARGQMLEARVKEDALAHMEACERCASRFADEQSLTAGLRAVAARAAAIETPQGVEAALLSAFRQGGATAPLVSTNTRTQTKALPWLPWSIAAAATFLIFSLFGLPRLLPDASRGVTQQEARNAQAASVSSQASRAPEAAQYEAEAQQPNGVDGPGEYTAVDTPLSRPVNRRRAYLQTAGLRSRPTPRANNLEPATTDSNEEITTDFMPISYGSNLSQLDDGQVVRVELPRSALQSFGLPVNAERAGERVKADVLLGHDGVARAIRFVR